MVDKRILDEKTKISIGDNQALNVEGDEPNFLVKRRVKYLGSLKPTLKAISAIFLLPGFFNRISLATSKR